MTPPQARAEASSSPSATGKGRRGSPGSAAAGRRKPSGGKSGGQRAGRKKTGAKETGPKNAGSKKGRKKAAKKVDLTARTADKHDLYQQSVQATEPEIDFVDRVYRKLRGRYATKLREDFCGTALSACEWVRRRKDNIAIGLDLDQPTLDWGMKHNVSTLTPEQQGRIELIRRNVLTPATARNVDVVLAMNFSYWVFKTRREMLAYFKAVRGSLSKDGVFMLDHYGGYESQMIQEERRRQKGFTYVWDQDFFDPISFETVCHIHFEFRDGTRMEKAFTYRWRLWTLPEIRELLTEAGFSTVTVYWEGDDGKGGGNGVFRPRKVGEECAAYVSYIVAER